MAEVNLNIKKDNTQGILFVAIPFIYLLILIIFSYFVAKTGYAKIKNQRQMISAAKKTENILREKESVLKTVAADVSRYVQPVSIALPEKNPALVLISQVKNLANLSLVALSEFKIGAFVENEALSQLNISTSVAGNYLDVISFFRGTKTIAPIITVQKLSMTISGDKAMVETALNSYWSAFPKQLPALTEPISKLSDNNFQRLSEVAQLIPPFFTTLSPNSPTTRENPFF